MNHLELGIYEVGYTLACLKSGLLCVGTFGESPDFLGPFLQKLKSPDILDNSYFEKLVLVYSSDFMLVTVSRCWQQKCLLMTFFYISDYGG